MRKMRAEIPSKLQQNHLGMESNASSPVDVTAIIEAEGAMAVADSPGRRAVSFRGPDPSPKFSEAAAASRLAAGSDKLRGGPVGFGRGRRVGEAPECIGDAGGRRNGIKGDSLLGPGPTADGGDGRSGMTGVVSGFWGSAL